MPKEKKDIAKEEFGSDLSPDDLDIREENDLTKEQAKNSNENKEQQKENK
ncbi:hypothetical protein ACIQXI_04665 [Lysinibacillus sp. NPDC097195]